MTKEEREAIRARCEAENPIPQALAVAKSLKWILNNIEDCGSNTFEHGIHKYVGEAIYLLEKQQDIPALLDALDRLKADRSCNHAGECRGCEIKQSECFSYMESLAKKYEKLALQNACLNDETEADRDQWKARSEALERALREFTKCKACKHIPIDLVDADCGKKCDITRRFWEFDEAKFTGGGGNGQ